MEKLKAYIQLFRPKNALMSLLGALTGWLNSTQALGERLLITCLVPPLILMAGNAINDYFDAPIDAINKPHRPIPSGRISREEALMAYVILSALGTALSSLLGIVEFSIAAFFSIAWYIYARSLKRIGVPGNILVSLGVAFTLIFGSLAAGELNEKVILFSSIAFTSNLAREFIKAVEDLPGDKAYGVMTIAVRMGTERTGAITSMILIALITLTLWPALTGIVGVPYLVLSAGLSLILIALSIPKCFRREFGMEARIVSSMVKVSMLLGMLGMMLDPIIRI